MTGQVEHEVLVHVGYIGHAALARQADLLAAQGGHLEIVRVAMLVDLRGGDDLVRDQAALVVPVKRVVAPKCRAAV